MVSNTAIDTAQDVAKNFALPRFLSTKWNGRDVEMLIAGAVAIGTLVYVVYTFYAQSKPDLSPDSTSNLVQAESERFDQFGLRVNESIRYVEIFCPKDYKAELEVSLKRNSQNTYSLSWVNFKTEWNDQPVSVDNRFSDDHKFLYYSQAIQFVFKNSCLFEDPKSQAPIRIDGDPLFYTSSRKEKLIFSQFNLCPKSRVNEVRKIHEGSSQNKAEDIRVLLSQESDLPEELSPIDIKLHCDILNARDNKKKLNTLFQTFYCQGKI